MMTPFKSPSAAPRCRWCDKPIRRLTRRVWLYSRAKTGYDWEDGSKQRFAYVAEYPTRDELPPLARGQIIAIGARTGKRIFSFTEWDGETYKDQFFCSSDDAAKYGWRAVQRDTERESDETPV